MTDDATIAALETAEGLLLSLSITQVADTSKERCLADAALIRALIAKLRNGGAAADERAKVVAWLRSFCSEVPEAFADAIEAGAHQETSE